MGNQLSKCAQCDESLNWPAPAAAKWAEFRPCPQCGHRYMVAIERPSSRLNQENDCADENEQDATLAANCQHTRVESKLLAQLVGKHRLSQEKRSHVRYEINRQIVCVPLNDAGEPAYESVRAQLLDMSDDGAGMRIPTYWTWPLLLLDFSDIDPTGHQLLAQVAWKRHEATGTRLGIEFIAPRSDLPTAQ